MRARRSAANPASAGSISTWSTPACSQALSNRDVIRFRGTRPEESRMSRRRSMFVLTLVALAALPAAAPADSVVSLGDSAISGEAGRWAGNTNGATSRTDALGPTAYYDAGTREAIPGCHRSKSAEVHIGGGITSVNLACSGARTTTHTGSDGAFKPGLDFYSSGANKGQAQALQDLATARKDIKAVV